MARTFVIAEIAGCHDGALAKAQDLVRLAASIGCNAVKTQWLSRAERLCERRNAPEYLAAYRLLQFPEWWFADLASRAADLGLEFMCTAYLPEDIPIVANYVSRFKVASFEAEDAHFVALHGAWPAIPLIISAGMAAHVGESLRRYDAASGRDNSVPPNWTVLACTSAYPCPDDQAALWRLRRGGFSHMLGWPPLGLSDHTLHPWTGALAVAAGAAVVEFHVRLGDTDPRNADFAVARDPDQARAYVAHIREAEAMVGDGVSRIHPAEESMLRYRSRQA